MSKSIQQIKSGKLFVSSLFSKDENKEFWYKVPNYQRPYVWEKSQIETLLDDIKLSMEKDDESQYFLGSIVLYEKQEVGKDYVELHLLDGQQRLITLLLIIAVIRDLTSDDDTKSPCREMIFKKGNIRTKTPERKRIVFEIREDVDKFFDDYIKNDNSTNDEKKFKEILEKSEKKKGAVNISVENMANAILIIRNWFCSQNEGIVDSMFTYLYSNVVLIYVSSQDQEDALRMFTILNDRGIKLRNSDILKANNLNALEEKDRKKWSKYWEQIESEFGDDFDEFLSYIRTIITKDKADYSLLKEFEDKIYSKKVYDKSKKEWIEKEKALLTKGVKTFEIIELYKNHYDTIIDEVTFSKEFYNLYKIVKQTSFSNIWIPPLLYYVGTFGNVGLLEFFIKLDNKFSYDWITGASSTNRIDNMNRIIGLIEECNKLSLSKNEKIDKIKDSDLLKINLDELIRAIDVFDAYKQRWIRYILYKLDYKYADHSSIFPDLSQISTEHILPQSPESISQWVKDFTEDQREEWTNKIGNLILISMKKNASLGNSDFSKKKGIYFDKRIQKIAHSNYVIQNHTEWKLDHLQQNHQRVLDDIRELYK